MIRSETRSIFLRLSLVIFALVIGGQPAFAQAPPAGTPGEIVATYNSLADGILALKRTEENLCRSILAAADTRAHVEHGRAQKAIAGGDAPAAQAALEALAANVAQMGTEGDNAVGAVRKRLIEAGQHHNAAGEAQGLFDEGFVIVNRSAKGKLLASSRVFAQLARAPKAEAFEAEWKNVQAIVQELLKPGK